MTKRLIPKLLCGIFGHCLPYIPFKVKQINSREIIVIPKFILCTRCNVKKKSQTASYVLRFLQDERAIISDEEFYNDNK